MAYAHLERTLLDPASPLPDRFRVLFALKSLGTPTAIDIIAKGTFKISGNADGRVCG
jgi:hypothetical protein